MPDGVKVVIPVDIDGYLFDGCDGQWTALRSQVAARFGDWSAGGGMKATEFRMELLPDPKL